jgi:hypothetical protein
VEALPQPWRCKAQAQLLTLAVAAVEASAPPAAQGGGAGTAVEARVEALVVVLALRWLATVEALAQRRL